ncbi:DUF4321 domain-containing protein [Alkalibacter rhizosphaerae]|uniref:DUF4321 domain-containing protein n=1 Tax=Alkalibacter rhizosphaerae TaxID=2815577 RepID=A0A974XGP1_9FIRM|nr:DUF4321 domain-containing protein [Alkalibacter rhizosphaerae]QSX07983.1 DUF4321 domain-containing protein [Alkalibacter rhizosphaerae]
MRVNGSKGLFIFILLFSLIAGTFIGELLGPTIPIFARGFDLSLFNQGSGSWIVDLHSIKLNLGLYMKLNLGSILFLIAAIAVFYKK